jgi:hypothetical protein
VTLIAFAAPTPSADATVNLLLVRRTLNQGSDAAIMFRHHGELGRGNRSMPDSQIRRYENRIVEEEKLARQARSSEIALAHQQVAALYKTQLAIVRRKGASRRGQTLADIW